MYIKIISFLIIVLAGIAPAAASLCTDSDNDGYSAEGGTCGAVDCDDGNFSIHPGAPELCDGKDNDCNGLTDAPNSVCDIETGLVGHWTMDASDITGSTITDRSGQGNDGTIYGTESVDGQLQEARSFNLDGNYDTDDFIEIADNDSLDLTSGEFTLSVWIKANTYGQAANGRILDHAGGSWGSGGWSILLFDDKGVGAYALYTKSGRDTAISLSSRDSVVFGEWQHIVATMSGGTVRFYIQGKADSVITGVPNPTDRSRPVLIGLRGDGGRDFDGLIDDVRIYNRALSESEVAALFYAGTCTDNDNDGYSIQGGQCGDADCNDNERNINPGAAEIPYDGIDQDCSGADMTDMDGDGYGPPLTGGSDCDDSNAVINPLTIWYSDADGDGYGNTAVSLQQCIRPLDFVLSSSDCDDTDRQIYPGAGESCDGKDTDCDGIIPSQENDHDSDGYSVCEGDCDDLNAAIVPTDSELCDPADSSCKGGAALTWKAPETSSDGSLLTDLAGYRVYFGESPKTYSWSLDSGTALCHGIARIPSGEWCFAVTAYDTSGNESEFSNEACKAVY